MVAKSPYNADWNKFWLTSTSFLDTKMRSLVYSHPSLYPCFRAVAISSTLSHHPPARWSSTSYVSSLVSISIVIYEYIYDIVVDHCWPKIWDGCSSECHAQNCSGYMRGIILIPTPWVSHAQLSSCVTSSTQKWRFPESWGYPQSSSISNDGIFRELNHPASLG